MNEIFYQSNLIWLNYIQYLLYVYIIYQTLFGIIFAPQINTGC